MTKATLYRMPRGNLSPLNADGMLEREWQAYLAGIQDATGRVCPSVAQTIGVNLPALEANLNAVIAALKTANLMKA